MWSVVNFLSDNTVEVVPSFWVSNDSKQCAWPKKKAKQFIKRRIVPNTFDFDHVPIKKIMCKDLDDYSQANLKAKKSEFTSNLSSNYETSDEISTRYKKSRKRDIVNLKLKNKKPAWSPGSIESLDSPHNINNSSYSAVHSDPILQNVKRKLSYNTNKFSVSPSPNNLLKITTLPSEISKINSKQEKLVFTSSPSKVISVEKCTSPGNSSELVDEVSKINIEQEKVVFTSSPFKIISVEKLTSQRNSTELVDETSKINCEKDKVVLSSSPLKVTPVIKSTSMGNSSELNLGLLHKINRTTLNIWYEIKALSERIENLEKSLADNNVVEVQTTDTLQEFILTSLPLASDYQLCLFEEKLKHNPDFKKKMVIEISRLARNTIGSSVRSMLRFVFKDELLKDYSYKGQKKKKVFSILLSCSLIFDAIKRTGKFKNCNSIDIEIPLKAFIAGAKFRIKEVTLENIENDSE